jgi:diadenosine tetraphosphate (Ap4A) HIT family hydrolase
VLGAILLEKDCVLCAHDLSPILADSTAWLLVLNRNQNLVGKSMLVARRHIEAADELTAAEWDDLRVQLRRITAALRQIAQPDHFNNVFLQNQDRHVHLHVIPRYASPRRVAGLLADDPDYPDHYAVPVPYRPLEPEQNEELVDLLRAALLEVTDGFSELAAPGVG